MSGDGMKTAGNTEQGLVYLCACAVNGTVPDPGRIETLDLEQLYQTAERHQLVSAAGMALEQAGIRTDAFTQAVARAQRKIALLDADRGRVLAALEQAGIWYMPLKGALLKDMYPRYGMRQMSDNDILFDSGRRADLRKIMEGLGFSTEKYEKEEHDVYYRKPVSNFEMHVQLINSVQHAALTEYYRDVKNRLVKDEGNGYGYHFTDNDFYLYLVAHEYVHYSQGGTGLRSLLDIFVFLKKKGKDLEWDYIRRETEKMGIGEFEPVNRSLSQHLFAEEPLTEAEKQMLAYTFSSGAYGTVEHATENLIREKGRAGFFLSRLTLPREEMLRQYPVLRKAPVLYPVMWTWRLIRKFFTNNRKFRYQLEASLGFGKKEE